MSANAESVESVDAGLKGFAELGVARQIVLMIGVAIAIAVGVSIVMWSREPAYGVLFSSADRQSIAEVVSELEANGTQYKLDSSTGSVMVPQELVYRTRLQLAKTGLPRSTTDGYELLDKEQAFGTSKMMEQSRFNRALEGELARSIETLHNVRNARVHLARPKASVFVRKSKKPSASVILDLNTATEMSLQDIEGIAHLVASSVPELEPAQVTIVDQRGRLLSKKLEKNDWSDTSDRLEYSQKIEGLIAERVQEILVPIVGQDGVRAQVSADLDFTQTEQAQEEFKPDQQAIRSEQLERELNNSKENGGIPGALTNQPPPAGVTADQASQQGANGQEKSRTSTVRNYELNRTLKHTRFSPGSISRLSVAVVIDNIKSLDEDNNVVYTPRSAEEMTQITDLVKQAVGFNAARGDTVTVTNIDFKPEELIDVEESPIWKDPFILSILKQFLAPVLLLMVLFKLLKSVMHRLVDAGQPEPQPAALPKGEEQQALPPGVSVDLENLTAEQRAELAAKGAIRDDGTVDPAAAQAVGVDVPGQASAEEELKMLEGEEDFEKRIERVREVMIDDPARAAQVVRGWIEAGA